ncbi:MAG: hypothetical protein MIO92_00950 [Methanosarcinaceae archaeon]|nr:hypothetical protein [Methanosarcinaceae archaeon]
MQEISFIEEEQVIEMILKRLELREQEARPPPKANAQPKALEYHTD